ncbi:sodium:sulfate symporter [Halarcobacter mediterraneus]|uniref:Sodium:sulfate symporter n=1 Tax=Halarcobacter mediterraneus TaxID=2023153 RepID=A0A4V1M1N7_9BACT|nr:SLC13 family permease [Halarcobacter mediterraneus]RXK14516.1 sodium:sulfate symporter [Halarcobacter mediterraneus]
MFKNIAFIVIPIFLYLSLFNFIEEQKDLLLISLILTTIIYWATNIVPLYFSSLIFLFTCLVFSLSTKEIIFSGFSSSAFWLVVAGMLIATAIKNVELNKRFTNFFAFIQNMTYLKILILISALSLGFSFIMPSSVVRIVLLVPFAISLAKALGFEEKDKGYIGILLSFILCSSIPAFTILPANVPNMILSGLTKEIYDYELLFSHYLLANFFILGFIKNIVIVSLIYLFFKDNIKDNKIEKENTTYSKNEKIVMITLSILLLLWLSDFIHKIPPSVIAIIGILFLAYPSINIIKAKDINTVNFSSLIFVAAIISLGSVVANNDYIKDSLLQLVNLYEPSKYEVFDYIKLTLLMSLSGIIITQPTIPAIYTPIAEHLSTISSFSLDEIFMMQVAAFSNVFFPFQAPPLAVGLALSGIKQKYMLKVVLLTALITIVFLYPLEAYWLKFIR